MTSITGCFIFFGAEYISLKEHFRSSGGRISASFRRTGEGKALMVLRLCEKERGVAVLNAYGVRIHTQDEIDTL